MNHDYITELYGYAFLCHQRGNLAEARKRYKEILKIQPSHCDALHLLGVLSAQEKSFDDALYFIGKALVIKSDNPFYLTDYANVLMQKKRLNESITYYQKAIEVMPEYADAYNNQGLALVELDRPEDAINRYNTAIFLNPKFYQAYSNRGSAHRILGRLDESVADFDYAISINKNYFNAHFNKGNVLRDKKEFSAALVCYNSAIKIQPNNSEVYFNCAKLYSDIGDIQGAINMYETAIQKNQSYFEAYINIGQLLADVGKFSESISFYNKAIALKKTCAEAYYNRGNSFRELKELQRAIESYDRAIKYKKNYVDAYYNKALSLLLGGNLQEGFKYYEFRNFINEPNKRVFSQAPWLGGCDLAGKTIFVYHEQGLGDTIQFCRYLRHLESAGAKILFAPQSTLMKLMESLEVHLQLVRIDDDSLTFDYHCPLMSLPYAFKTNLENIPSDIPYLAPSTSNLEKWTKKLGPEGFKVGVCWQAGNTRYGKHRSFSLSNLKKLSLLPNVRLISLQKEIAHFDDPDLLSKIKIEHLGQDFDNGGDAFIDTSSVMKCCDLIITADTAIAHLAGALGVTVWVALNHVPDWRYFLERDDSPWYPTMRLFRQTNSEDWNQVFDEMANELSKIL
jgi:tetratricopeptide (TPR) repeat protein